MGNIITYVCEKNIHKSYKKFQQNEYIQELDPPTYISLGYHSPGFDSADYNFLDGNPPEYSLEKIYQETYPECFELDLIDK